MLATFFVHDGGQTSKWRLKGHAESDFWKWLSGWAVVLTNPADLGYSSEGYDLPELNIQYIIVPSADKLASTLSERRTARRNSLEARCASAAKLVECEPDSQWLMWCDLNDEADTLTSMIENAVEVRGSDKGDIKTERLKGFTDGDEMSKEQFRIICHISKATAAKLLKSGIVPCIHSGKKTRCYTIKKTDVQAYLKKKVFMIIHSMDVTQSTLFFLKKIHLKELCAFCISFIPISYWCSMILSAYLKLPTSPATAEDVLTTGVIPTKSSTSLKTVFITYQRCF